MQAIRKHLFRRMHSQKGIIAFVRTTSKGKMPLNQTTGKEISFTGYEYKEVVVSPKMERMFSDGYSNFGWKQDYSAFSAMRLDNLVSTFQNFGSVIMTFKRDRKIHNKMEVTRLQRQFESCVSEIEKLERSIVITSSAAAYGIGILGIALLASAVLSYLSGMLVLSILLSIPALIGCIIPYPCYIAIIKKKAIHVEPLIDQKYDEIYEVCEKASALLAD